jgi:hypothetical protein
MRAVCPSITVRLQRLHLMEVTTAAAEDAEVVMAAEEAVEVPGEAMEVEVEVAVEVVLETITTVVDATDLDTAKVVDTADNIHPKSTKMAMSNS